MKISIDGILGTAQKINSQKELEENNPNKKRSDVKTDTVSIGSRIFMTMSFGLESAAHICFTILVTKGLPQAKYVIR